ncbi:glycosyltransferase family protein [Geomonas oryzae]|uniref:glycosyl transferase family 2 n=1 Tax=Geomonas oryzae TaxID=2364273 RepID=UPI00100A5DA5|nr:glycosyl transferase family 2 [Geomonas oryzae]
MKSESFVSVVVVEERPLAAVAPMLQDIQGELDRHFSDYEVVAVGQGTMQPFTLQDQAVLEEIPSLRYIQLSSRVSPDVAWGAGLENAIGDFAVMFDSEATPVRAISETVALCKSGYDVVVGVAKQPRTIWYRMLRPLVEHVLHMIEYSLPRDATGLRCLSRRAVNSVSCTGRFHQQLPMRIQKTGYPQIAYNYALRPERRRAPRSLWVGARALLQLMVFNSSRPLRWMSGLGFFGSCSAFLFGTYSLLVHLVKGHVVEGWTTTILFMSALFMMQFVMMAFFGEYLGRLLDRSEQAEYSVVFEKNSAVMVNKDRLNVLSGATTTDANLVQTGRNC